MLLTLKNTMLKTTKTGGSEFYGWGVGTDLNNSKNNAIYLGSAGIGAFKENIFRKTRGKTGQYLKNTQRYVSDNAEIFGRVQIA